MPVVAFKEKSKVLAEQNGWSLTSAKGYVDGEAFRRRRKAPSPYAMVGIDDYSEGFRAGYFDRPLSAYELAPSGLQEDPEDPDGPDANRETTAGDTRAG